jgi:hypothetical protein
MGYPTVRLYLAQAMIDEADLEFEAAWCVGNDVVSEFSPEELQGDEGAISSDVQAAVVAAVRECVRGG